MDADNLARNVLSHLLPSAERLETRLAQVLGVDDRVNDAELLDGVKQIRLRLPYQHYVEARPKYERYVALGNWDSPHYARLLTEGSAGIALGDACDRFIAAVETGDIAAAALAFVEVSSLHARYLEAKRVAAES